MTVSKGARVATGGDVYQSIEPTGRHSSRESLALFSFHGGIMTLSFGAHSVVLSLIVSYVPGLNTAYEKLDGNAKRRQRSSAWS